MTVMRAIDRKRLEEEITKKLFARFESRLGVAESKITAQAAEITFLKDQIELLKEITGAEISRQPEELPDEGTPKALPGSSR